MICKVCGMDSKTPETCSWCGAAMNAAGATAAATPRAAPKIATKEPEALETTEMEDASAGIPFSLTAPPPATPNPAAPPAGVSGLDAGRVGGRIEGRKEGREGMPGMPAPPRKMAPGMPPPSGKQRIPAPPAPMNRPAVASLADMAPATARPPAQDLLNPPAPAAAAPPAVPSLMEQAQALVTPPTGEAAPPSARPAQPPLPTAVRPEATIGSGVTPPKTATPAASPPVSERQKRAIVDAALAESAPDSMALLGRYLGVFAVIVIVTGIIARFAPTFYVAPLVIAMFVAALLLPVMRVTPWVEEDAEDLGLFILLTLVFGPLVALVIYGVVALVRQSFNASILGCLATVALLRIVAEVASGGVGVIMHLFSITSPFTSIRTIDGSIFKLLLLNWSGLAALAGWYAASSFHKEDE